MAITFLKVPPNFADFTKVIEHEKSVQNCKICLKGLDPKIVYSLTLLA
jgi:hypothetical protein